MVNNFFLLLHFCACFSMSLSSQTYNFPNSPRVPRQGPCPGPFPLLPSGPSSLPPRPCWAPAQTPLGSSLLVAGFLYSQLPVPTPVSSTHPLASPTCMWALVTVQTLTPYVWGQVGGVCHPAFVTSPWVTPMPLSTDHSVEGLYNLTTLLSSPVGPPFPPRPHSAK